MPHLPLIDFGARSGLRIPRVNIGGMRLPKDVDQAVALIRHAIDQGMIYIDTSRGYGDSEVKFGKALKDGYRDKVILSTKWSPWITKIEPTDDASADCVLRRIEESMQRLDVDMLDYYQVWNMHTDEAYADTIKPGGFLDGLRRAKDRGLIRHIGFTSHYSPERLLEILPDADWCEILLVTYNILNQSYAPVLRKAKQLGIGTIVMNPVAGGRFGENSAVFAPLLQSVGSASCADLAVRYVLSNPNIDTLISGIGKMSDVDDTIASAGRPLFTESQLSEINGFIEGLSKQNVGFCTSCGYCMPCPQEVNIPKVMEAIYNDRFLGFHQSAVDDYRRIKDVKWIQGTNAEACTACGECLDKCTQHLPIPDEMTFARERLGG